MKFALLAAILAVPLYTCSSIFVLLWIFCSNLSANASAKLYGNQRNLFYISENFWATSVWTRCIPRCLASIIGMASTSQWCLSTLLMIRLFHLSFLKESRMQQVSISSIQSKLRQITICESMCENLGIRANTSQARNRC